MFKPGDGDVRIDGRLSVSSNRYGKKMLVVSLAGEMDASNVSTARAMLHAAFLSGRPRVVVDLHELEFLDSSGIELLLALAQARGPDGLTIVPSPSPEVTRILDATGMGSLIVARGSEANAG